MTKTTDAGMRERRRSSRVSGNQNSGSRAASAQAPLSATPASADIPAASEAVHGTASRNHNLKKRKVAAISIDDPIEKAMQPLTAEERQSWRGWIELESEPVLFNHVLQSYGVKDVMVQDVVELGDLRVLGTPVHGLIFLFQYQDIDAEEAEDIPRCPKHVWFANQTTDNACATIALLNIVMNSAGIDLGDALAAFKKSTRKLKPAYRGKKLGENDYIRNIHNSFVRRMDILNADLGLQNEYDKWTKRRRIQETSRNPAAKPKKAKNTKSKAQEKLPPKKKQEVDESAHHFIAYVPVNGSVWKLDGLRRQPVNIGHCGEDWTTVASDNILQRITSHKVSIQFNLMALIDSPLVKLRHEIARIVKSIRSLEDALDVLIPDWKVFTAAEVQKYKSDLEDHYDVTPQLVEASEILKNTRSILINGDAAEILQLRKSLGEQLTMLKDAYIGEIAQKFDDAEKADARKYDYTPDIYNSIKAMSESGALKDIVLGLHG